MFRFYSLLIGYAFGHLQTSYILGKTFRKIDIREHGTGNPGTMNSVDVMGMRYAVVILVIDVLKSVAAYAVCSALFNGAGASFVFGDASNGFLPGIYGSAGAILGHSFPIYMRFRGGKGMACYLGLCLSTDVLMTGLVLAIAILTVFIARSFSPAAIVSLVILPAAFWFIRLKFEPFYMEVVLVILSVSCILMLKHRGNIRHILNGTDRKLGKKPPA
ncbi:MAG: glycerol-3-phosphate acyltransferase [Defluviitaleaceae bacterium]|nr:glycerol-3-phosphate acyltransferase [Defluviitaleaceae bacterium]MCL2837036.1 glycerol-3-phosphate acyltransferase [Defluviitaleaceae bacterium]